MKRFFLIPLMTLLTCVMAWGATYYVGGTQEGAYEASAAGLASAFTAANTDNDVVQLGANVALTETFTVSNTNSVVLNLGGFTLSYSGSGTDFTWSYALEVAENANLTISGSGEITSTYPCQITETFSLDNGSVINVAGNLVLSNGDFNLTAASNGNSLMIESLGTVTAESTFTGIVDGNIDGTYTGLSLAGGNWTTEPDEDWLAENYYSQILNGYYNVYYSETAPSMVATLADGELPFATLAEAIPYAALYGDITLCGNVEEGGVTVSADVTINYSTYDVSTVVAGEGYTRLNDTENNVLTFIETNKYNLKTFLTQGESGSYTIENDVDISELGTLTVVGNKVLTLSANVYYKRQTDGANIVIPAGATLTVKGNGTLTPAAGADIDSSHPFYSFLKNSDYYYNGNRAIDVYGTLNVGVKDDANNCPHFITTSIARGSAIMTNNGGVTTINNAHVQAANAAIWNEGTMYINGGTYVSTATSSNGINSGWYSYCIRNQAKMVLKNATVVGNHGAVGCEGGDGTLEIHNCNLQARNLSGLGGVHYALYVCTKSVVSAYDTKFYSDNASNTIYIGDNDSQNSFGLIYLYDGCKSNRKLFVQQKRGQDDDLLFPVLVSEESAWYKVALRAEGYVGNDDRLLPANCEYKDIDEQVYDLENNAIEGAKYLFGVVNNKPAEQQKEVDENATTIPWQQSSTWNASASSESTTEVPTEVTVVTIPEGKTVVISADENENNGVTEAKAEQIFLADGAKLTVETGTTLTVGEGGVNIANGGQIVVEPGAIVTVGSTGLVTTEEEALVIEATEEDQGVFLLKPEVTENTQPKATVKLVTKCKQKAAGEYVWERFAIPTLDGEQTTFSIEGGTAGITTYDGSAFQQGLYGWSDAQQDWVGLDRFKDMKPFKGYQLSNNSRDAGVTYVFEGNLVGNTDQNYQFAQTGFGFFGNSYTGDIDILKFFESFNENMQKTIWIYDYYTDNFKAITANNYGTVYYGTRKARHGAITDIRSMQAFLMNTFAEGQSVQNVDYSAAIWGNPKYGLVAAPAPKRVLANNNEDKVTIYVATDKSEDEITFVRSNEYSAEFDNGADASKWMNSDFNLYAVTDNGELAVVASDEIVDMTIAFKSGKETEYTLGFDNLRGEQFELRDVLTGATIQMMEGTTYTFSQEANTTIPARFQILGAKKVATDIENVEEGANVQQKVVKNGVLYILRDNKWYNAQGQLVK